MSEKARIKAEKELASLEAEFRARLVDALRRCAAGQWGLFGYNEHLDPSAHWTRKALEASGAPVLFELGKEIAAVRERLGLPTASPLFARFIELRGRKDENTIGEPKLALALLEELGEPPS